MSYSFVARGANKPLALAAVAAEFDRVNASCKEHQRDRAIVLANAEAVVNLLADDDSKHIQVSCNGSLSLRDWNDPANAAVVGVGVNCSAHFVDPT